MAKYYGLVGYVKTEDIGSGKWKQQVTERSYYGDVIKNSRRLEKGQQVNDNISVNNIISIIADPYATLNFFAIRYIHWMGTTWDVTDVEVQSPRLLLTIGGKYNGPTK